jgi:small subunit ribosomal protein S6
MRTYETIFIVHPEVTGDAYQQLLDRYREILGQQNAVIHKFEEWGVRRLAYPLAKQTKGTYVLAVFDCLPAGLSEFERRLRLDEGVLKYQSVHLEKYAPAEPKAPVASGEGEGVAPETSAEEAAEDGEEEAED